MIEKFRTYKGYPLVRCGNVIYYGYMSDPYVTMVQILKTKKVEDDDFAEKVRIVLMNTDPNINPLKAFEKNAEFECGLYEALDTAGIWLEKALSPENKK